MSCTIVYRSRSKSRSPQYSRSPSRSRSRSRGREYSRSPSPRVRRSPSGSRSWSRSRSKSPPPRYRRRSYSRWVCITFILLGRNNLKILHFSLFQVIFSLSLSFILPITQEEALLSVLLQVQEPLTIKIWFLLPARKEVSMSIEDRCVASLCY